MRDSRWEGKELRGRNGIPLAAQLVFCYYISNLKPVKERPMPPAKTPTGAWIHSGKLYVLLTQAHCQIPILDAARQVVRGGADVIQLREREVSDRKLLKLAHELRSITRDGEVGMIVNDRPDVARLSEADGVHLGQDDLPPAAARKLLAAGQVIGVSTHSIEQAKAAAAAGAGYIGVGPVFSTPTRGYETGLGIEILQSVGSSLPTPMVAIGGITLENVPGILAAMGNRPVIIAVCSAILMADDIEEATAAFKRAITHDGGPFAQTPV
jgi:thiamine-phosphate pyrophosphorylase